MPRVTVENKEAAMWKRCLVLALGVAQLVAGAIVIYYTAGTFSYMGAPMMM